MVCFGHRSLLYKRPLRVRPRTIHDEATRRFSECDPIPRGVAVLVQFADLDHLADSMRPLAVAGLFDLAVIRGAVAPVLLPIRHL